MVLFYKLTAQTHKRRYTQTAFGNCLLIDSESFFIIILYRVRFGWNLHHDSHSVVNSVKSWISKKENN